LVALPDPASISNHAREHIFLARMKGRRRTIIEINVVFFCACTSKKILQVEPERD
jgi:hypothetical protein